MKEKIVRDLKKDGKYFSKTFKNFENSKKAINLNYKVSKIQEKRFPNFLMQKYNKLSENINPDKSMKFLKTNNFKHKSNLFSYSKHKSVTFTSPENEISGMHKKNPNLKILCKSNYNTPMSKINIKTKIYNLEKNNITSNSQKTSNFQEYKNRVNSINLNGKNIVVKPKPFISFKEKEKQRRRFTQIYLEFLNNKNKQNEENNIIESEYKIAEEKVNSRKKKFIHKTENVFLKNKFNSKRIKNLNMFWKPNKTTDTPEIRNEGLNYFIKNQKGYLFVPYLYLNKINPFNEINGSGTDFSVIEDEKMFGELYSKLNS